MWRSGDNLRHFGQRMQHLEQKRPIANLKFLHQDLLSIYTNTNVNTSQNSHKGARWWRIIIQDFLKLKTPKFRGEEGEDPQEFLEETEKMTHRLTCSEARVIELVGITMKSNVWEWYKRNVEDRLYRSNSPTWKEFKWLVMDEFLPPTERQSRAFQFKRLR